MNNRMTYTQKQKLTRKEALIRAKKITILKKRIVIFTISLVSLMTALIGANAVISAKAAPSVTEWSYQATGYTVKSGDTLYSIAQTMRDSLSEDERSLNYNSVESIAQRLALSNPELGSTFDYAASHLYPGLHLETMLRVEE